MTAAPTAPIRSLLPWFGAKRTLALEIVRQIGPHRSYWEPFCGSMAVLLAKPTVICETVSDLHGDLMNLAKIIQHPTLGPALYRRLRRTWGHEALFREASDRCKQRGNEWGGDVDLERAFDFFFSSWLGMNGFTGTKKYNRSYAKRYDTLGGGTPGIRYRNAVHSIPTWRKRLEHVNILKACGFDLLEKIVDAPHTAIYCDPPYIVKGESYVHEFEEKDHERLAKTLQRFKYARVVVSYYAHEMLAALYPDWTVVNCKAAKALTHAGHRSWKHVEAPEVLLINGPRAASGLELFDSLAGPAD